MPVTVPDLEEKIKALKAENKALKKEHSAEIKSKDKEHSAEIKSKDKEIKALNTQIKKKKRKDPDAPKRPKNGFMFFTDEKRNVVKAENKNAKPTEISIIIGKMWTALKVYKDDGKHQDKNGKFNYSNKAQKYLDKASKDKKRYEKELKKYQKSLEKKSKKSSKKAKASS